MKAPLILRTMPALLITIVLLGLVAYYSGLGLLFISPAIFLIKPFHSHFPIGEI